MTTSIPDIHYDSKIGRLALWDDLFFLELHFAETQESCNAVIQTTKAYNQTSGLHYAEVKGIVDRDRRSEEEILKLKEKNIFVPQVAEIENLFLVPEVIDAVADKLGKMEKEEIILETKEKTFDFLQRNINEQALLFTRQKCQNSIMQQLNASTSSIEEFKENLSRIADMSDVQTIYEQEIERMNKIIEDKDYLTTLKVINNKGLLPYTQLANKFGWKKDYYIDFVLKLTEKDDEAGNRLKRIFVQYISSLQ